MLKKDYIELKSKLIEDFSNTIPKEYEDKEILIKAFENYINYLMESFEKFPIPFGEHSIEKDVIQKADNIINDDLENKIQRLIGDIELMKIDMISENIFETAIKVLNGKKVKKDFLNEIEEMKKRLPLVKSENSIRAKRLVSEAILDSDFIENPNTQCYSFRLAREKKIISNNDLLYKNER